MQRRGGFIAQNRVLSWFGLRSDHAELRRPDFSSHQSNNRRCQNDEGKGRLKEKNRDEREGRDRPHHFVLERFAPNPDDGRRHDRDHGRLETVKNSRDPPHLTIGGVNKAQRPEDHDRREHEKCTGHDPSRCSVQEPADVNCELRRFRAGQEHAEVERVKKTGLPDPALFFHQLRLHDGDLPGRPAETDEPELEPETKGFPKTGVRHRLGRIRV